MPFFFFLRNGQADPKIPMKMQGTQNSQNNVKKKNQILPISKLVANLQ